MHIPDPQQREQRLNDRTRQFLVQLIGLVMVPIDVAPDASAAEQLQVVAACEQTDVVDLRDSRHEALNRSRDEVLDVLAAERIVERAVDLRRIDIARRTTACAPALAAAAL